MEMILEWDDDETEDWVFAAGCEQKKRGPRQRPAKRKYKRPENKP
jgi:hypothetical protein